MYVYINDWLDTLVTNIRKIAKRKGISISTLESDLQFSPGLISRWSKTKTSPGFDKIMGIANYLDVSIEELMQGIKETNAEKVVEIYQEDSYLSKKIAQQSEENLICWENANDEIADFVSIDKLFKQWYCYDVHKVYFAEYINGFIFLAVQFNTHTLIKDIGLYLMPEKGMEPKKVEEDEGFAMKTLRCTDIDLYNTICNKNMEEFRKSILRGTVRREIS